MLIVKLRQSKNYLKNYTKYLLENIKDEKNTHNYLISKFNKGFRFFIICY